MKNNQFSLDESTDNYCVIGNPIAHSKSPRIHALFAQQTSQLLTYQAVLSQPDAFLSTVEAFRQAGGKGLNVTLPFKEQAWEYVNNSTDRADRARAVNFIRFDEGGRIYGDSTDGIGLIRDLANNRIEIANKRILIIGAGGAVRSVLGNLIDEGPDEITIVNRTPAKAGELVELFPEARGLLHTGGFDGLANGRYDLVINGASAGLAGHRLPLADGILAVGGCCYDMTYGKAADFFLDWAEANGAQKACDGLGMLLEQAAESFYLWRGIRPETIKRSLICQP